MQTCFVIQPFDGATYDKRFNETFAPAIEAGGAKPIRADEVLGTRPVIEKIEGGLRSATIAFAEVSEDNANVFLELGYALALNVPTVIVCEKAKRSKLPFDISHRTTLFYSTDSQSSWEKIGQEIKENVTAALAEASSKKTLVPVAESVSQGALDELKQACLLEFLDFGLRSPEPSSLWGIQRKLVSKHVSDRMIALATASLVDEGFLEKSNAFDQDSSENYVGFNVTESGQRFILRSYTALKRQEEDRLRKEDDIPF